jgi:hypothetical protein
MKKLVYGAGISIAFLGGWLIGRCGYYLTVVARSEGPRA